MDAVVPFRLATHFAPLRDPRVRGRCDHRLLDIIVLALCAVVANCNDWQQVALFARERRDWFKDTDQKRFSEEFLLTIDNARRRPIDVVIREHLYRGQNWTLAYQSAVAAKEGPQQISLRTQVPANGRAKVLYVVVYTW